MIRWMQDQLLAWLQHRCEHPGEMVAVDILEGCAEGIEVRYCRRCGAVKTEWSPLDQTHRFVQLAHTWRRPDPNLWREKRWGIPLLSDNGSESRNA